MSFGTFFIDPNVNKKNFYQQSLSELSTAQDTKQLSHIYQRILSQLAPEDGEYKIKLSELNKAQKFVFNNKILRNLWCAEYLKQFRSCLVNKLELYKAFLSTGNLNAKVTQQDLMYELYNSDYSKQLDHALLNTATRPTNIKIAIHFYSIPQNVMEHYNQNILDYPDASESVKRSEKQCYAEFEAVAEMELKLFYDRFQGNVANYLFYLLKTNVPAGMDILKAATLTDDDLTDLSARFNSPSTVCNNKVEICRYFNEKIASLPQPKKEEDVIEVVYRKSRRQNK